MSSADVLSKEDDSKNGKEGSPPMDGGLRNRGKGRRSSTAESIANAVAKKVPKSLRPVVVRFLISLSLSLEFENFCVEIMCVLDGRRGGEDGVGHFFLCVLKDF